MSETPTISASKCPLCKKPTVHAFRPFCSQRCKQVDLGRWFQEVYTIPDESQTPQEETTPTSEGHKE